MPRTLPGCLTLSAALTAALALLGSGCDQSGPGGGTDAGTTGAAGDSPGLTVAVVPKSTGGEFWETVKSGAMRAGSELGVAVKWEGTLTETEIAEQNKIIENMLSLDVDGMAIAPLNERATSKPVGRVVEAGKPVVVFDSAVQGDAHTAFVATDNAKGGALGADALAAAAGDLAGKRLFVMRFVQGTGSTEARAQGFIDGATAAGGEIVADPYPEDGTVAGAKKTARNALDGFVKNNTLEIDGVFAANLVATLGVAEALNELRQSGIAVSTKFVGFDTSEKLVRELQAGNIDALVAQNPEKMGFLAVETLVKHLRGEAVEAMVDTGVEVVTAAGLESDPALRKLVGLD